MLDLVGNPEDLFSQNEAHIFSAAIIVAHKLENHSQIAVMNIEMLSEQYL